VTSSWSFIRQLRLQYFYGWSLTHYGCHGNVFNKIRVLFRNKSWTRFVERNTILRYSCMWLYRFSCGQILWNLLYVFIIIVRVFLLYMTQIEHAACQYMYIIIGILMYILCFTFVNTVSRVQTFSLSYTHNVVHTWPTARHY